MTCYFKDQKVTFPFLGKYLKRMNKNIILQFVKLTRIVSLLKITFFLLLAVEVFISLIFITYFPTSLIIAISIGIFLLTIFAYFVSLFYFQTKKPEQINELRERFIRSCRQVISVPKGSSEHHLSVADGLLKLSIHFNGLEYNYFPVKFFSKFFSYLSLFFHREDIFKMREELIFLAVEEHIKQIKNTPTDLEVHVSLANAYVSLAKLYLNAKKKNFSKSFLKKMKNSFQKKFEMATKHCIEEFIILKSFAPNDPWILAQLAQNYRILGKLEEAILEYEALLELSQDQEIMFRLGKTYFESGKNAQGLQIYEELKKLGYKKARELLFFYSTSKALEDIEQNI
jgi:tetratricopeptide (TPR) repeat protein